MYSRRPEKMTVNEAREYNRYLCENFPPPDKRKVEPVDKQTSPIDKRVSVNVSCKNSKSIDINNILQNRKSGIEDFLRNNTFKNTNV